MKKDSEEKIKILEEKMNAFLKEAAELGAFGNVQLSCGETGVNRSSLPTPLDLVLISKLLNESLVKLSIEFLSEM